MTGHVLATLEGHTGWVTACTVTPGGRRVVSASYDQTLKIWDLETYACLMTHGGDASYEAVAATTTVIVAGDIAGGVWFLDMPSSHRSAPSPEAVGRSAEDMPPIMNDPNFAEGTKLHTRPTMKKRTILFLAANPAGTPPFALVEELFRSSAVRFRPDMPDMPVSETPSGVATVRASEN